jgi:hypothetical protein
VQEAIDKVASLAAKMTALEAQINDAVLFDQFEQAASLQTELEEVSTAQKRWLKVVDRGNGLKRSVQFAANSPKTEMARGGCEKRPHVSRGLSNAGRSWLDRVREGTAPGYGFGNDREEGGEDDEESEESDRG